MTTKLYIGTSVAFPGTVYDHLFLIKAPSGDITTDINDQRLIEAAPSVVHSGHLVVGNDLFYNDSGNRLDINEDGDLDDVEDLQPSDKGIVEITLPSGLNADDVWTSMVNYVNTLGDTVGGVVDTGYQYSSQDYVMFYLYSSSCSNVWQMCNDF